MSLRRIWTGQGERAKEKKPAECSNGPKCLNGLKKPAQPLKAIMTSSAAFRCVQAWLLEKPAVWAEADVASLAAARACTTGSASLACVGSSGISAGSWSAATSSASEIMRCCRWSGSILLCLKTMSSVSLCAVRRWSAASRSSRKRTEIFVGGRTDELGLAQRKKKPAKCSNGPKCLNGLKKNPPQLLKEMTSSKAFRCVQAWLLEKPAAWADEDAPCLAAALMAQRPPTKRPREDALLEAERSHQRRRIELLEEQLLGEEAEVRRLEKCLVGVDLEEIMSEVSHVSAALDDQATRSQRAELALRWFEAHDTWSGRWEVVRNICL